MQKRSAEQVLLFIDRAGLNGGIDIIRDKGLLQVLDVQLGGAGLERLLLEAVQLRALTDVAGDGNDLAVVVVLLEPRDNDRGIQTARIRQDNLFNLLLHNRTSA